MGLGFAATRDIVSYLRHESADAAGTANVLAGRIDLAFGFGLSQIGRYLHDFLYWGFNTDEAGRPVFEGLMPHIAGGKKTFTNYRFSQPGRSPPPGVLDMGGGVGGPLCQGPAKYAGSKNQL